MYRDDESFTRDIDPNCWDAAARIAECDRDQVGTFRSFRPFPRSSATSAKPEHGFDLCKGLNDHIRPRLSRRTPKRFVAAWHVFRFKTRSSPSASSSVA